MSFLRFMGWGKALVNSFNNHNDKECYCSDSNGFYITKREASIATSIIITLLTILLTIGYLWGQRSAIQEFSNKVINDSLADQVNYSMYSMYGENVTFPEESEETNDDKQESQNKTVDTVKQSDSLPAIKIEEPAKMNQEIQADTPSNLRYFANLIGYGQKNKTDAEEFVNKLKKKGYNVLLIPRKSKTSKNKTMIWYQVSTQKFEDKAKLEKMIDEIKQSEHLKDIKLITTQN